MTVEELKTILDEMPGWCQVIIETPAGKKWDMTSVDHRQINMAHFVLVETERCYVY